MKVQMISEVDYIKHKAILRGILEGRGFHMATKAMNFAEKLHDGLRRDGSPEFAHQVAMALHACCFLPSLDLPQETITVIFLHDVMEDKGVEFAVIESQFDTMTAVRTLAMSKIRERVKLTNDVYYRGLSDDQVVSVAKGFDRSHNLSTMRGAFNDRKQIAYLTEARQFTLPMLKQAQRKFPSQTPVYEGLKHVIRLLCDLTEHFIARIDSLDTHHEITREE